MTNNRYFWAFALGILGMLLAKSVLYGVLIFFFFLLLND